mgnify:CR=1 FL=1
MGGNSVAFLDYFKHLYFPLYGSVRYSCLDISNYLLEKCKSQIESDHLTLVRKGQIKFKNDDISEYKTSHSEPVLFVLFEILDNLPHDKILIDTESNLIFEG